MSTPTLEKPVVVPTSEDVVEATTVEASNVAPEVRKERGLLSYIGYAVSVAVLVLVATVAILVVALPTIVGGSALTVLTNSMAPKLPPGTLIVERPTPLKDIRIGDVLTYQIKSGSPAVISHRVIERDIDTNGKITFITKGDNNSLPDPRVLPVQVKGTLWYSIPYLGWVNNAVSGSNRGVIVPILAGGLFAYAFYTIVATIKDKRKKAREKKQALASN